LFRHAPNGKIRIGYYSADFHDHATARLMAQLLEEHDTERFEVYGFSFGPDRDDGMRRRVCAAVNEFFDVRKKTDIEVAELSRELKIDIAVDLKGYTQDARPGIFAHGCAPVQVNYLGYPGTMGAEYMNYLIADSTVSPEETRACYTEKLVYLPGSYQVNDSKRSISSTIFAREEVGLPSEGFVFCSFNNNYKITPSSFDGWARILSAVEGSVLWLLEDNPTAAKNLRQEAEIRGIAGSRLVFAERMPLHEHLARHRLADLFLDTLPCNAHTTASDALWAGLPVLTCMGRSFAGRVAASLLRSLDLSELVTNTQEAYERRAKELAANPAELARIRNKLAKNRGTGPLFDGKTFAKQIEAAYQVMYDRYKAGLPPAFIDLSARPSV
jgi:predicted O-linked N-acetylglucosamine transferase (SPINDLY family)